MREQVGMIEPERVESRTKAGEGSAQTPELAEALARPTKLALVRGPEQPLGTLSFKALGDQHFAVDLADTRGTERHFELHGDMWQLDVRVLKWANALARIGFQPGYRMDRLSGRYLSLEDEQTQPRSVIGLREEPPLVDSWLWLHKINRHFSLIDATYGSATYLPMADGAMFSVDMGATGLIARPLNDRARLAVQRWQ